MSTIVEETQVVETFVPSTVSEEEGRRREILLRAADLIEQHGWTYGKAGMNVGGPHCILGAVAEAAGLRASFLEGNRVVQYLMMHEAATVVGIDQCSAFDWNDRVEMRQRDDSADVVATALRRMANGALWEEATTQ